jgi:hypothetical protein
MRKQKGEDALKVLAFVEFRPEDTEKVAEKFKLVLAERKKGSEKFPKLVFPAHIYSGEFKIIAIFEDPTEEQLNNLMVHYLPVLKFNFVPLTDYTNFVEQYLEARK